MIKNSEEKCGNLGEKCECFTGKEIKSSKYAGVSESQPSTEELIEEHKIVCNDVKVEFDLLVSSLSMVLESEYQPPHLSDPHTEGCAVQKSTSSLNHALKDMIKEQMLIKSSLNQLTKSINLINPNVKVGV